MARTKYLFAAGLGFIAAGLSSAIFQHFYQSKKAHRGHPRGAALPESSPRCV
jgi:hypothetical protein